MLAEHGIVRVAPSTYYAYAARGFGPTDAELDDAYAANRLHQLWVKNRRLYGRRKLWKTVTALTEVPQFCSADSSGRRYTALV